MHVDGQNQECPKPRSIADGADVASAKGERPTVDSVEAADSSQPENDESANTGPAAIRALASEVDLLIAYAAEYVDAQRDLFVQAWTDRARAVTSTIVSLIVFAIAIGTGLVLILIGLSEVMRELFSFAPWLGPFSIGALVVVGGVLYMLLNKKRVQNRDLRYLRARYVAHEKKVAAKKQARDSELRDLESERKFGGRT